MDISIEVERFERQILWQWKAFFFNLGMVGSSADGGCEGYTALLKEEKLSMTFTYVIESSSSFSNAVWRGEYL
jgi:hypothetical protein